MDHKLANGMKIWKRNGNTTTLLFSLKGYVMRTEGKLITKETKISSFLIPANNRNLFSNTLTWHSSLNVKDHVSQPYSTVNVISIYIYFFCAYVSE